MSGMTTTPTAAEKRIVFRRMHEDGFFLHPPRKAAFEESPSSVTGTFRAI